jgi:hypothetical protein
LGLDAVGESITFGEARDLIDELARRWESNYAAALANWKWTASFGEITNALLLQSYLTVHRDAKKQPKPVSIPMPWDGAEQKISAQERDRLMESLRKRSAFKH